MGAHLRTIERSPRSGRCAGNGAHTILVAGDRRATRRQVANTLRAIGFAVIEVGSGCEGLSVAAARRNPIDLAIVDIVIPMSGLDLALTLERQYTGIEILFTTRCADTIAIAGMLLSCPERVLLKPFTRQALIDRVFQLVR